MIEAEILNLILKVESSFNIWTNLELAFITADYSVNVGDAD